MAGEPSDTGFPFARNAAGVAGELGGKRLRGNPAEIRPVLESFEPYEGGNDLLWGLNSVRNPNTHRMIVPTGQAVVGTEMSISNATIKGGKLGYSEWNPAKNELEYMRLGPGSTADYKMSVAFDICFSGTNALSGKPVIASLHAIASEVERVVLTIEAETARHLREKGG